MGSADGRCLQAREYEDGTGFDAADCNPECPRQLFCNHKDGTIRLFSPDGVSVSVDSRGEEIFEEFVYKNCLTAGDEESRDAGMGY